MVQATESAGSSGANRELDTAELLDYSWKYFSLHADQRLRTFNFFLILAAVLVGGSLTALNELPRVAAVLGFYTLLPFSFVFWKLDQRTRELVKHGEAALKAIEEEIISRQSMGDRLSIFTSEERLTASTKDAHSWWKIWSLPLSYSDCFGLVFLMVGLLGFVMGSVSLVGLAS